jgi:hypothetical protein
MPIQQLQHLHGVEIKPSDQYTIGEQLLYSRNVSTTVYVGVGGDMRVLTAGGDDVTFHNIQSGHFIPVHIVKIFDTGTTAAEIIALDLVSLGPSPIPVFNNWESIGIVWEQLTMDTWENTV